MRVKRFKELKSSEVLLSSSDKRKEENALSKKLKTETDNSLSAMSAASKDEFSQAFISVIRSLSEQVSSLKMEISHLHDRIEKLQETSSTQAEVPDICTRIMKRVCYMTDNHNIDRVFRPNKLQVCPYCLVYFQLSHIDTRVAFNNDPIDISHWTLIENNDTIFTFMSNDDGMYQQRKDSLMRYLYAVADESDIAKFRNSICTNLFHPNYRSNTRWPHTK